MAGSGGGKTVENYIKALPDWRGQVVRDVCAIVGAADTSLEAKMMWGQPVFRNADGPVCYVKAFASQVHCGFWWGRKLKDPDGLLQGEGAKMAHIKLRQGDKIPAAALRKFVKEAAPLNRKLGDPTRTK